MAMGPTQKRITFALWGLILVAVVGIVVAKVLLPRHDSQVQPGGEIASMTPKDQGHEELFAVPEIKLTDQEGLPFSTAQLRGRPWIADFIFTSCGNICPIMSAKMEEIQNHTPIPVNLVSFTVDPEHDTPGVLRSYGQHLQADFLRWHFLTGSRAEMADAAYQMKISVKAADASAPIMHSDKFLLVDGDGKVVGIYNGTSDEDVKRLMADATKLSGREANPL
jgi:protein SCO1/2